MKYLVLLAPMIIGIGISIYLFKKERDKKPLTIAFAFVLVVLGFIIDNITMYGLIVAMTLGFSLVYLVMSIIFIKAFPTKHEEMQEENEDG